MPDIDCPIDTTLTMEKLKIHDRLHALETSMIEFKGMMQRIDDNTNRIHLEIQQHSRDLYGNGNPGLKTIVDRHEQRNATINWVLGFLMFGTFGLVFKLVYDFVSK